MPGWSADRGACCVRRAHQECAAPERRQAADRFLTSQDGQQTLAEAEYLPAMPSVAAKTRRLNRRPGVAAIMLSPDTVTQNRDRWIAITKDLFN